MTRVVAWMVIAGYLSACAIGPATVPPVFTLAPPRATPPPVTPTPASTSAATLTVTATPTPIVTPSPTPRHVAIISIDGLRPDALQQTPAPNIRGLAERGAFSFAAQTIFPPVTLPSHTSMLTGYGPEAHGVDWNDYEPARGPITTVPTLFELAHRAGLRTVLVAGKEKFKHLDVPGTLDALVYAPAGDNDVTDNALAQIAAGFDLLFIHLPTVDQVGHAAGWMSEPYLAQVTRADEDVGRLLAALPPDTVVIVTADHGGLGLVHGRDIPEDRTIPWIIAGPDVRENYELQQPVVTMDTAATAAHVLGLSLPDDVEGRPVLEAFTVTSGQPHVGAGLAPAHTMTRLLFTGDINPGRCPAQRSAAADDFTLPYHAVAAVLRGADLTVGSLDGTLSDVAAPSPCPETLNLIGPARAVEGLAFAGFDVITTATNHAKDCGAARTICDTALRDTRAGLLAAGIQPVGSGDDIAVARTPIIIARNGVRFAFLGVCAVCEGLLAREGAAGVAPLDLETLLADIAAAREQAEVVVVLPQWGVEYAGSPSAEQREWAQQMLAAGATLVVGNHPHVIHPIEPFPHGLAAYALGNFVFDQGPPATQQGIVLEATFEGAQLAGWRALPVIIEDLHQPRWADGDEAAEILKRVENLP
jgi:poly-gamma-glutamate capsule biosynthesis protein CapA/YwtB (metallophosphatase superfamily)